MGAVSASGDLLLRWRTAFPAICRSATSFRGLVRHAEIRLAAKRPRSGLPERARRSPDDSRRRLTLSFVCELRVRAFGLHPMGHSFSMEKLWPQIAPMHGTVRIRIHCLESDLGQTQSSVSVGLRAGVRAFQIGQLPQRRIRPFDSEALHPKTGHRGSCANTVAGTRCASGQFQTPGGRLTDIARGGPPGRNSAFVASHAARPLLPQAAGALSWRGRSGGMLIFPWKNVLRPALSEATWRDGVPHRP